MDATPNTPEIAPDPVLVWGLSFAQGYLELGMLSAADRELDRLAKEFGDSAEVMSLRSHVLLARKLWPQVIEHARRAVKRFPGAPEYYVHAATAFDMLGLPAEGRQVWLSAPAEVRASGFFHLHVARFEAKLGNVSSARSHLERAFDLDPKLRAVAGRDPNLARLIAAIAKN